MSIVAAAVGLAGLIGAAGIKLNRKANADIRASAAQDRMAAALEKMADGGSCSDMAVDIKPCSPLTKDELDFIARGKHHHQTKTLPTLGGISTELE